MYFREQLCVLLSVSRRAFSQKEKIFQQTHISSIMSIDGEITYIPESAKARNVKDAHRQT
jgi:hypothetical protein